MTIPGTESAANTAQISSFQYDRLESTITSQSDVLNMISNGERLEKIFSKIISWVERTGVPGSFASILCADDSGEHLIHGAAPSLPVEYNNALHGTRIGPEAGLCATVAYTKQSVVVEDIEHDPFWRNFEDLALKFNLHSCSCIPLISKQGKVLGTFAVYHNHPHKYVAEDMQMMKLAACMALLAIEHYETVEYRLKLHDDKLDTFNKIKHERKKFYDMLMQAPAMIAVLDGPDHVFELVNERYQMAVGKGRDLIGLPLAKGLPEVVSQGIIELLDGVYNSGEAYIGNELLVRLDRQNCGVFEDRFFNFIYQPIKNDFGITEAIFVHAVDITDQVIARKKAEESEERFRSFVLNAPTPIGIYVGREMRIQMVNKAVLDAWDKDESVIGKTFSEALPELEGQPFFQLLDDVFTSGVPYQATEDRVELMRNGKLVTTYYNFTYSPLRNRAGEIFGVMNTATEVTDLVLARQKLAEAQAELKHAVEVAELATWNVDMLGKVIHLSERMQDWLGLPAVVSVDQLLDRVHASDRREVISKLAEVNQKHSVFELECRVIHLHTGHERILHIKGTSGFRSANEIPDIHGVARDVTIQKQMEMELERQVEKRTQQLQKLNIDLQNVNENLKQFAYIASHDLQEPLRKIKVYSDILLNSYQQQLDPTAQSYISKVAKSAGRMSSLIKDLLEFSRVSDDLALLTKVDLCDLMNNIKVDFEVLITQKNAIINIDRLCSIEAVALQMNQLFYNLIGNALKFSKAGSAPVVTISCRQLSRDETDLHHELNSQWQYLEIIVQDNGIGFKEEHAEKIFEIFQRLHGKSDFEGTGIGLALCRKIVTNHGGLIFARSKEGEGASFQVILPIARS